MKKVWFDEAVERTLEHEGFWSDDKFDPGGKTKYGITELLWEEYSLPRGIHKSIDKITVQDAVTVYFEEFWLKQGCHLLEDKAVALELFDTSVNCGRFNGTCILQRAFNFVRTEGEDPLLVDGKCGPATRAAINRLVKSYGWHLLTAMNCEQYAHYSQIKGQRFKRGWITRVQLKPKE